MMNATTAVSAATPVIIRPTGPPRPFLCPLALQHLMTRHLLLAQRQVRWPAYNDIDTTVTITGCDFNRAILTV